MAAPLPPQATGWSYWGPIAGVMHHSRPQLTLFGTTPDKKTNIEEFFLFFFLFFSFHYKFCDIFQTWPIGAQSTLQCTTLNMAKQRGAMLLVQLGQIVFFLAFFFTLNTRQPVSYDSDSIVQLRSCFRKSIPTTFLPDDITQVVKDSKLWSVGDQIVVSHISRSRHNKNLGFCHRLIWHSNHLKRQQYVVVWIWHEE